MRAGINDNGDSPLSPWGSFEGIDAMRLDAQSKKRVLGMDNLYRPENVAVNTDDVGCSGSTNASTRTESHTDANKILFDIPTEILVEICGYLAACEVTRQSLNNFALTSRRCCDTATPERFFRVRIYASSVTQLRDEVILLQNEPRKVHVRTLEIFGQRDDAAWLEQESDHRDGAWHYGFLQEDYTWPPPRHECTQRPCWAEISDSMMCTEKGEAWEPIATLLSELTLNDLVWAFAGPMPHCILRDLQKFQADCRLHVHTFSFRSLYLDPSDPELEVAIKMAIENERLLTNSPCLHSVMGPSMLHDCQHLQKTSLTQMLSTRTPQVRHVFLWPSGSLILDRSQRPWESFRTKREGGTTMTSTSMPEGRLASLRMSTSLIGNDLDMLRPFLDPSNLTSLDLSHGAQDSRYSGRSGLAGLADAAEKMTFQALRELAINLASYFDADRPNVHADESLERLLRALPPLETLRLQGAGDLTFSAIVHCHQSKLKHLVLLEQVLTLTDIRSMSLACLQVHELRVGLQRTKGDGVEVKAYQALGAMCALRLLTLDLYSFAPSKEVLAAPQVGNHYFDNARIRNVLQNAAMDEMLARSIFNTIMHSRDLFPPVVTIHMAYTGVKALCRDREEVVAFKRGVRAIGQSWRLERDVQCRSDIKVNATRLRRITSKKAEEFLEEYSTVPVFMGRIFLDIWVPVWKDIWPGPKESWPKNWESLPLCSAA